MTETPNTDADADRPLMPIGQFSALSRLSVRMLRHYDAHGVLVPADVDPWTGQRRYAIEQLGDAADIRTLRDVGFGVSAISALLASRGTATWRSALQMQRDALVVELREAQGRLALIDRTLSEGAPSMITTPNPSITVERRTVSAMTIVALRGTVPTYSDEGILWQQMMPLLGQQGIKPAGPCGVIEHIQEYVERDPDLSVFLPVEPGTVVEAPLEVVDLPARECVVARVLGSYDQISTAYRMIGEHMAADSLTGRGDGTLASASFSIYRTTPDEVAEADLVTDVHVPVA